MSKTDGGVRVTLAVLGGKIDALNFKADGLGNKLDAHILHVDAVMRTLDDRVRCVEILQSAHSTDIKAVKDDLGPIKTESRIWNGLNSLMAAAAGILAGLRGQ
jgi:hypothetical protein